jgi:hypothetical protein
MKPLAIVLFSFVALCGCGTSQQPIPLERTAVYFPPEAAGGKLSLFTRGGAVMFTGNGWTERNPGEVEFLMQWQDERDVHRIARCYWSVRMPSGRFIAGSQKSGDKISFTLTESGHRTPIFVSQECPIEIHEIGPIVFQPISEREMKRIIDDEKKPNQAPEPTP